MTRRKKKPVRILFYETIVRHVLGDEDKSHIASLCEDMKNYMPTYLVVEVSKEDESKSKDLEDELTGRIAFFMANEKPYSTQSLEADFYELDKLYLRLAMIKINEISASKGNFPGIYGYMVPLMEDECFEDREDVNAYLHNLMFWESLLNYDEYGPAFQHIDCLTQIISNVQKICVKSCELLKNDVCYVSDISNYYDVSRMVYDLSESYEYQIRHLNDKLQASAPRDFKSELQAHYDEITKIIGESRREYEENAYRNEMLMKQMEEFQALMKEEEIRKERRNEQLNTMESLFNIIKQAGDDEKEQ